jgi:hypothetical protein
LLATRSVSTNPPARPTAAVASIEAVRIAACAAYLVKERMTPPYLSHVTFVGHLALIGAIYFQQSEARVYGIIATQKRPRK